MKKTLLVIVIMALIIGLCAAAVSAKSDDGQGPGQELSLQQGGILVFSDVEGHWAAWAINKAQARGIFSGYGDGTFGPENLMTNAQVLVLLDRISDDDDEDDDADDDDGVDSLRNVPTWANSSVRKAVNKGYINRFHSDTQCRRAFAFAVIAQELERAGKLRALPENYENPFKDVFNAEDLLAGLEDDLPLSADQLYNYMMLLHYNNIIKGSDGSLNANSTIKRAEMAVLMNNVADLLDDLDD